MERKFSMKFKKCVVSNCNFDIIERRFYGQKKSYSDFFSFL